MKSVRLGYIRVEEGRVGVDMVFCIARRRGNGRTTEMQPWWPQATPSFASAAAISRRPLSPSLAVSGMRRVHSTSPTLLSKLVTVTGSSTHRYTCNTRVVSSSAQYYHRRRRFNLIISWREMSTGLLSFLHPLVRQGSFSE